MIGKKPKEYLKKNKMKKSLKKKDTRVAILTEAGKKYGLGHINRCIALCHTFEKKNIHPELIINSDQKKFEKPKVKKFQFFDWLNNSTKLKKIVKNTDIVIIDSFVAKLKLYKLVYKLTKSLVCIDDNNRLAYPNGTVLNVSLNSNQINYPNNKKIKYLLGTKYTILRKEFWSINKKKIKKKAGSIMITFGGYDKKNMTLKVLKFLVKEFPAFTKNIIVGRWFKEYRSLLKVADKNTVFIKDPTAKKIKNLMLTSDIAISAGGQTLYEMARIGIPTIGVAVAKNQLHNLNSWKKIGFLEYNKTYSNKKIFKSINKILPFMERKKRSERGSFFLDGKGSIRICDFLLKMRK